jgi:hypothetical protein
MTPLRFPFIALTLALTATGCTADEGEVCFADGDCSSGLFCCKTTAVATGRGRCLPEGDRCSSAPRPDGSVDSGTDAGDAGDDASDATTDTGTDTGSDGSMDASMSCDPSAVGACDPGYCRVSTCGAAAGECVMRPTSCDGILAPVCACSGATYTNECEAGRAAVSIARTGSCDTPPADTGVADAGSDAADATPD